MALADSDRFVGVRWLVRLRWAGLVSLALAGVVAPAGWLPPTPAMLGAFAAGAAATGALHLRPTASDGILAAVLAVDIGLLTALLALSGGAANPFVSLYVFPVVLAALLVRPAPAWAVFAGAAVAYGSLFELAPSDLHDHGPAAMRTHLLGMFVAYLLSAWLLAIAVGRVRAAKADADRHLAEARSLAERNERIAALATLAAGAAHELATPLSTILVAAGELERGSNDDVQRDVTLIREEVQRCRDIVAHLSVDSGSATGEAVQRIGVRDLGEEALEPLPEDARARVTVDADAEEEVQVPVALLSQVIRRLVGNAIDATTGEAPIQIDLRRTGAELVIVVRDHGSGMSPDVLRRATEPFFTTKPAGMGRGLGLYFVASVVAQLGGRLVLSSEPGAGTEVRVTVPGGSA